MKVVGKTVIVTMLAMASRPVNKPVLSEKRIRRLMMLSERLKPVRELCRSQIRAAAMTISDAAPRMLIERDNWKSEVSLAKVLSWRLSNDYQQSAVNENDEL